MMRSIHATLLAAGCIGLLPCPWMTAAQEAEPIILKPSTKDFIYFAGASQHIYASVEAGNGAAVEKKNGAFDSFSVSLKSFSLDMRELPEVKLECQGVKYVVLARKIVMVPPEPTKDGIFVQAALDPNGTGNYEVMLTINWSDWPDTDKRIKLLTQFLPEALEVVENGAGWSNPKGGLALTMTMIFHNKTGRLFTLETGYFENLPTTENWPVIEVPPAN